MNRLINMGCRGWGGGVGGALSHRNQRYFENSIQMETYADYIFTKFWDRACPAPNLNYFMKQVSFKIETLNKLFLVQSWTRAEPDYFFIFYLFIYFFFFIFFFFIIF